MKSASSTEKAARLTGWFPVAINPVRCGVYEVKCDLARPIYAHWNGSFWGFRCGDITAAFEHGYRAAMGPVDAWRGLARKPK